MILIAIITKIVHTLMYKAKIGRGNDKKFVISDWKSDDGVIDYKKTKGNVKEFTVFRDRRVFRGMPRIGLIFMIMLGLVLSSQSLKIENEEGKIIYDDVINTSLKIVDDMYNDSRTLGDDLWDTAKIVGKGIGQVFPQMHDEIVPERKD